jgi:hypothetical protein
MGRLCDRYPPDKEFREYALKVLMRHDVDRWGNTMAIYKGDNPVSVSEQQNVRKVVYSANLKELAGRIKKLPYRDLVQWADLIDRCLDDNSTAEAILDSCDAIELV